MKIEAALRLPGLRTFRSARFRTVLVTVLAVLALLSYAENLVYGYRKTGGFSDFHLLVQTDQRFWSGAPTYLLPRDAPPDQGRDNFNTGASSSPYAPSFFLLFWPWAWVGSAIGRLAWLALGQVGGAVMLVLTFKALRRPTRFELLVSMALCLTFLPVRVVVEDGQLGLILGGLMAAAFYAWWRRREAAAGAFLAAAIAIKLTPALMLAYFFWRRAWRACVVAALSVIALGGVTLALGWLDRWRSYGGVLGVVSRGTALGRNQALGGLVLRLFVPSSTGQPIAPPPRPAAIVTVGLELALVAVTAVALRRLRARGAPAWAEFSVVMLVLPALQPFAWEHHWAPALVAVPTAVLLAGERRLASWAVAGLAGAYFAMLLSDPLTKVLEDIPGSRLGTMPLAVFGASLFLFAALAAAACVGFGYRLQRGAAATVPQRDP
ncbi:MAG: glycosyltransferase family 87 protein [Candidatus Dormibacteria bacterium]